MLSFLLLFFRTAASGAMPEPEVSAIDGRQGVSFERGFSGYLSGHQGLAALPLQQGKKAFTHKQHRKTRFKVRGIDRSGIIIPVIFNPMSLLQRVVISGLNAYTQPYCLSRQYSYLFRLTPF